MKGTAPSFLIAMPNLRDPNFSETVILMLDHNDEGAVGLVVNRPFPGSPQVVCAGLGVDWAEQTMGDIRVGGPVRPQAGCLVHPPDWRFSDTQIVTPDISVSTSREALDELLPRADCPFRLLLGYAGWGPGQLEQELSEGTWLSVPVSHAVLFETPAEQMYESALASMGISRADLANTNSAIN
ncbi:MAG TPA: YqgE/AlgH family protein [Myxococcales bacterium]|nr:YqgE/AlgH family protein [Myxococcales bacterium]